jgi:IS30 family transposase
MLSMLKRHEIQTLARAKHSYDEIAELTGVPRRTVARVIQEEPVIEIDDDSERRRRGIGRPSKVEPFRELVRKVLEDEPRLLSVEIFRRVKLKGYRGQKSAMYAMIHELRPTQSDLVTRFEGLPNWPGMTVWYDSLVPPSPPHPLPPSHGRGPAACPPPQQRTPCGPG